MSGKLRTQRTEYPGAKTPSEQVMGPNHEPFSLEGRWDDRYNFEGFAKQTRQEFEGLCRRGSPVRIQFEAESFDCLLTDWDFEYHRSWDIRYSFTASVHSRSNDADISNRSPEQPRNARQILDDMSTIVESIVDADTNVPDSFLSTGLASTVGASIFELGAQLDAIEVTIDVRLSADVKVVDPFRRLATQTRSMQSIAQKMNLDTISIKADVDLGPKTAVTVLLFETWSRSLRFNNRVLISTTVKGSDELDERAAPNAIGLYRPSQGESIYHISRLFYGTPHGWRLIAERNNLPGIKLTGDELLIIPEKSVA